MNLAMLCSLKDGSGSGTEKQKRKLIEPGFRARPRPASFANMAGVEIALHTLTLIGPVEERDESEDYGVGNGTGIEVST
jgi:hypothetical protein